MAPLLFSNAVTLTGLLFLSLVAVVLGGPIDVHAEKSVLDTLSKGELKEIQEAASFHRDNHWKTIGQPSNHLEKASKFEVRRGGSGCALSWASSLTG